MGKQVCFYASSKDIEMLIDYIHSLCAVIMDSSGNILSADDLRSITDVDYCEEHFCGNKFFLTRSNVLHFYQQDGKSFIDQMQSEIIELSLCRPSPQKIVDTTVVDNNYLKDGFVVITDSEAYHRQIRELMENPTYIPNPHYIENGFDNGRIWYSPDYIDENGVRIKKSKDLHSLYASLSRFIKGNFRITKDKFAYIGQDAYKKYAQGDFIPCSGRYRIIVD